MTTQVTKTIAKPIIIDPEHTMREKLSHREHFVFRIDVMGIGGVRTGCNDKVKSNAIALGIKEMSQISRDLFFGFAWF